MSLLFAEVLTNAKRPQLSEELSGMLDKSHGGVGLTDAVAVTDLGGTGKTQLVLRYIEEHEREYTQSLSNRAPYPDFTLPGISTLHTHRFTTTHFLHLW